MIDKNKIPKHWENKVIGDVCKIFQGYGFPIKMQGKISGRIKVFKVGDISQNVQAGNKYLEFARNFIDEKDLGNLKAKVLPKNTIVFAKIGEALKLNRRAITKEQCIVDNNAIGLKANTNLCLDLFLYYYFSIIRLEDYSRATTVPSVRKSDIEEIFIPLPPLSEQQQIVSKIEELFSELDKGKQQLETVKQQLKTYRQAVLKWAFEGRYISISKSTAGTSRDLSRSNENSKSLPEGWKWVKLGEVCKSVEYGSAAKSNEAGKVPVLRMGNIQKGKFDWADLVFTSNEEEILKYTLNKNDVLFNRTNSPELVGKTAIFKGERKAIFAGYLIRINRIKELIDGDYLNYFLNSEVAKRYGMTVKTDGVNQSNINGQKLKGYPIPLCVLDKQIKTVQEIETRLSVCDKMEETIENSLRQVESLRQSILKQAFEGKLL